MECGSIRKEWIKSIRAARRTEDRILPSMTAFAIADFTKLFPTY
jgi:hypothetical protein